MDNTQKLLRDAEMQQKNLELQIMFNKNMAFFKHADPSIYQKYQVFKPEKIFLIFTEEGYIDLANTDLDNKLVYGRDPKTFSLENIENYFKTPFSQRFLGAPTNMIDLETDIHTSNLNRMIEYVNDVYKGVPPSPMEPNTEFMLILGIGLGYHIEEILKRTHVRHLNIVETHEDVFFASLHTTDWENIALHFEKEDTSLNLVIGQKPEMFSAMMTHHLQQIGIFSAAQPFIFSHLTSPEMEKTTTSFFSNLGTITASGGYYDDERIGLSHTINNFKKKLPFLKGHSFLKGKFYDTPVLLIANGPSLDLAANFIRENHQKCILVSCGTALSSLCKLGIKPDFHVELERNRPTMELIEAVVDAEFRKGITLLAINTVYPGLSDLFDRTGMGLKYNDLGAEFIVNYLDKKELFVQLGSCNPTVSNAGLSFCTALGFSNIYLVGLDLGFASDGGHHSSLSFHYDVDETKEDILHLETAEKNGTVQFEGNFGGKITSTPLYASAKNAVELIIADFKKLTCFNTSNGVLIKGATPKKVDDINTDEWESLNKKEFCDSVFTEYFTTKNFSLPPSKDDIKKLTKPCVQLIDKSLKLLNHNFTNRDEVAKAFIEINKELLKIKSTKNNSAIFVIKGSISSYMLLLMTSTYVNGKTDVFNKAKQHFIQFLSQCRNELINNFIRNDERRFLIAERMLPTKKTSAI